MKRLIVAACCLLLSSPVVAQKVGDTVVVIVKKEAKLKSGDDVVGTVPRGSHLRVDDINGSLFEVNYRGAKGWINRDDVIHIDKAIDFFTRAIRRNPNAVDYICRGSVWRKKGKYDIAIGDFNEAIRLDPKDVRPYNSRGNTWRLIGQYGKAISDYNEAIRLDPKGVFAYLNRGNSWKVIGQYTKAISDYNEAIRLNPKMFIVYIKRGTVLQTKGKLDKAIADYNEAIRLNPKYALAYYNRGMAWKAKGQFDRALYDYNESIRLNPDDALSYYIVAWLQATCSDPRYRDGRKAVENATKASELTGWKNYYVYDTLAAAHAENDEFGEAVKWQEKAIELAPAKKKDDYRSRLELYKVRKPYREKPKK